MARAAATLPSQTLTSAAGDRADRVLRHAAILFLIGFLIHNGDHLRRGVDVLTPEVLWAGSVSGVLALAAIALALMGHRLAPLVAVAVGLPMALGVAAVHLLPRWSAFSDSLADGRVDALSWIAVLAEIAGALAFGAVGAWALRRGRRRSAVEGPAASREPARSR